MLERFETFFREQAPALAVQLLVALGILVAAWIVGRILAAAARRALEKRRGGALTRIVSRVVTVTVVLVGLLMALDQVGVDIAAILAGAGILGLAIGFGAQSLVKDVISGFFLLMDDAIRPGDVVAAGGQSGFVEDVGLRVTRLRAFDGQLWYVKNGDITAVGNFNREWCRAVVEVGVAYEGDVGKALRILQEVGEAWAKEHPELVVDGEVEAQGLMNLADSSVGVRLVVKVQPLQHWAAERELRRLVKQAFDEGGVEIPFPRSVVYHRSEKDEPTAIYFGRGKVA